ncbi:thioredoxin-like protein [Thelephora terrestris]|uniref:Monothiol glutaredoxin-5, mitochondrial n=1 Tax=Thelephora terrestris TaxID=56493 RepID=A0A9P6HEB8_9AGAM|nr:thioredoxin-like protein [Thelephora terrestris]
MLRSLANSSLTRTIRRTQYLPTARRWLTQEARQQLETTVKSSPVVLFMKGNPAMPQCGFSRAAIQILELHGVPPSKLKSFDVLEDSSLRSDIKEFSEWPTVPQIYVNGEFIGGCDILLSMHQSGELEKILVKEGVISPTSEESTSQFSVAKYMDVCGWTTCVGYPAIFLGKTHNAGIQPRIQSEFGGGFEGGDCCWDAWVGIISPHLGPCLWPTPLRQPMMCYYLEPPHKSTVDHNTPVSIARLPKAPSLSLMLGTGA